MLRTSATCEPLGALVPGPRPLEGKSFYLDEVKGQTCGIVTASVVRLGGTVESFLNKDVSVVVTGNRDGVVALAAAGQVKGHDSSREQRASGTHATQRSGTPRAPICGSRGKALLEKAIRNNEQSRGGVLSSAARFWGVKIVSVDQFLKVIEDLDTHLSAHTHRRTEEKNLSECSRLRVIKAGSLKVGFVKVEDSSRKYRPLHVQSLDFPMLSYTRRFSPFESPAPVHPGKSRKDGWNSDKSGKSVDALSSHDKASARPKPSHRKRSVGFCECCQLKYRDQEQHLQSDVHQRFVEAVQNYAVVDRLVAAMEDVFSRGKELQLEALTIRLSSCSEAPPSESEPRRGNGMEPSQKAATASREHVCDPSVLPQEVCVDAPPSTPKFLDEKQTPEPRVPSPQPLLNINPEEPAALSPGVPAHRQIPGAQQELSGISLRTLGSLNDAEGSLEDPKQAEDEFPPSWLPEQQQNLLKDGSSPSPPRASAGLNPRKRSRSFTLSPRTSKVRRTNLWSDLTDQNSGVDVRFDPLSQSRVEGHAEVYELKLDVVAQPDPSPDTHTSKDRLTFKEPSGPVYTNAGPCDASSELGPPQLYPFFLDDVYQNQPFLDPPKLLPSVASNASALSQSFSSVCLESALVPDTFSLASSESDWDSGLLSRLGPPLRLQPKEGHCELDLGLLLQSSCSGMQDGSYASRLCSVLQPSSHAAFGDSKAVYRPVETVDRRVVQSLGV